MNLFRSGYRISVFRAFAVGLGLLLCSLPALPQLNLGRIYGAVTDQSGGLVPGAMVMVTDVARGVTRTLITDPAGEYAAPSLLPGTYSIRVEAKGFSAAVRQDVAVGVGQDVRGLRPVRDVLAHHLPGNREILPHDEHGRDSDVLPLHRDAVV